MAPVDLLQLTPSEFKNFLNSFDHVFSDCDGVIWDKAPLPGVGNFFKLMKKLGKTVNFVSNNSSRSIQNYKTQFKAAEIENGFENLTIPSIAIAEYLKSQNFNKKVYCVTCPEAMKMFQSYGLKCEYGPDVGADYYGDFVRYLEDDPEIGAVAFDSDYRVNLPKLYKARTFLSRPDVLFLNGATDKLVPLKSGQLELGTGVFTDLVVEQVKRQPIQLGKPGKVFGEFAMRRAGVTNPSRVLFIGDMIEQDIGLGKATGFITLLVLTNVSKERMMSHQTQPDYYAPSLESLVRKIQEQ